MSEQPAGMLCAELIGEAVTHLHFPQRGLEHALRALVVAAGTAGAPHLWEAMADRAGARLKGLTDE